MIPRKRRPADGLVAATVVLLAAGLGVSPVSYTHLTLPTKLEV